MAAAFAAMQRPCAPRLVLVHLDSVEMDRGRARSHCVPVGSTEQAERTRAAGSPGEAGLGEDRSHALAKIGPRDSGPRRRLRRSLLPWPSGKWLERGCKRWRQGPGFAVCPVGLDAFGALSGPGGGDLVLVELQEVVGRCC